MARSTAAGLPDDLGKWLALAAAAASLGILPKGWQETLGAASALVWLLKQL
jgi:hypothetical protein